MPAKSRTLSRRTFFKTAGVGAVGLPVLGCSTPDAPPSIDGAAAPNTQLERFDFTKESGALQADTIVDSACQFCNSNCRLKVHLKDGRIIDVVGEPDDPVQAAGLCVKAPMMTQLVYNRLRLKTPLKRVGGEKGSPNSKFEPCSWNEALDLSARKFIALRDAGEARAIANKTSGRLQRGTGSIIGRFFSLFGSPNDTDVGPVCNDAGGNALAWTFGLGNFTNGYGKDDATGNEDLGSAKASSLAALDETRG
jgi:anaerobic selenocysteine-containing dehydrogenase